MPRSTLPALSIAAAHAVLALAVACSSAGSGAPSSAGSGEDGGGAAKTDGAGPVEGDGTAVSLEDAAASSDGGEAGSESASDGGADGAVPCAVSGAPGQCITVSACAALTGYTSTPGLCPGPADIECCTMTPNVASNPPIPAGYKLMAQADVTPAMTTWAVSILNDPTDYPMFSTATQTFGSLTVLARVEWHPPDFQNSVVHRGVTLYEPI